MERILKKLRQKHGLSQRELARKAGVSASYICNAETRGFKLYPRQAERLAAALDWEGDPSDLTKEVDENDVA